MSSFDPRRIVDHETTVYEEGSSGRVESTTMSPIDAFNYLHSDLYEFHESFHGREASNALVGGGMYNHHGMDTATKEPNSEEQRALERFRDVLDGEGKWAETWVKDENGREYVFDWNLRKEADPQSPATPFSVVKLRSEEGYSMGFRLLRHYEPSVMGSDEVKGSEYRPDLTSKFRRRDEPDEDEHGWIQEPFLRAALDRKGGVHDALAELDAETPRLTTRSQVYVDERQSPGENAYGKSRQEFGIFYEWMEPVFDMGLQKQESEKVGEYVAVLNAVGLMGYTDRTHPELFIETVEDDEFEVIWEDHEFDVYTNNPKRIAANEVNDLRNVIEQGIRHSYRGSGPDESGSEQQDIREIPPVAVDTRREKMDEIEELAGEEDILHLLPANIPGTWDEDLFPDDMTRLKEW